MNENGSIVLDPEENSTAFMSPSYRLVGTIYSNYKLVVDESDRPVAVMINGREAFHLNDSVLVKDDGHGYICPGVTESGFGRIVNIRQDDTDHFFGVRMENGEFGYMKSARLQRF